ncbi:MAG: flagellar export protein FliJ [Treponema sp.]|jgi:flagellar FliJ protein|nr:flagellar export protein FliJ [Treponema sp.]
MKRFWFGPEKVMQLRKFKEEECKLALGQAVSVLNMIENKIKETAVKRHNAALRRFADIGETNAWEKYIMRLDQEAQQLTEKAAQAEIVVEEKRALYLEAQKDLKIMEKLKEKRQKEYRKEMLDYEMNEVDDITSARFTRNLQLGADN